MEKALVVVPPVSPLRRLLNGIVRRNVDVACAAAAGAALLWADRANAALDFTGVTLNTADVEDIMMLVIPALAALWGFRKIVKTMNRS